MEIYERKWLYVQGEIITEVELGFCLDFKPMDDQSKVLRYLVANRCKPSILFNNEIVWQDDHYEKIESDSDLARVTRNAGYEIDKYFDDLANYVPRTGSMKIGRLKLDEAH